MSPPCIAAPRRRALLLPLLLPGLWTSPAWADEAVWRLLARGGQLVLLRHARTTPGVGDPAQMRLDDCSTQRNLSEDGRAEARRLGAALRARAVPVGELLSSPWCRCIDTARLALGRDPDIEPALGNLFGRREQEAQQLAALRGLLAQPARVAGNRFWVTHGSTTRALTGVSPAMGELVVLAPEPGGGLRLAGRLTV